MLRKFGKNNAIYAYYQQIKNGTAGAGRWITLVYEYIIDGLEHKRFFFDGTKAGAAIDWIEGHCFHTEGDLAPSPLKLELWQRAFISCIFGLVDADGVRFFREFVLVVARKNGKTKLSSSVADFVFQNGGFGSRVFCLAPKLEQADLVYGDVWAMIQLDPEYQEARERLDERDEHNKRIHDMGALPKKRQADIAIPATNSTVKKIAFNAKSSDGFNPSLTICDEIASWQGDKGLKQYEVMKSAQGARKEPMLLAVSTSGYVNDGIYDELIKRSTRLLMGESKETRLLPFLYMIDDVGRWNDINELRKSNPNLGVSVSVDYLLDEIAIAEGSLSKKSEFITKYCNIKQNSSMALLTAEAVERACGDPIRPENLAHSYAVAGIDLSQTTDLTAAVIVVEKNGDLYVLAQFFAPAEKIDEMTARDGVPYGLYVQRGLLTPSGGNYVDYHDCFNWFVEMVERYEILPLMVGYDRYSSQYLCGPNGEMAQYGFRLDDVYQGENLYPCILEAVGLLDDGKLHIGDNDLLKIHMLNSALKMSVERGRGKLIKLTPADHIDGFAALIDAICVRAKWWPDIGEQLQNED